MGGAFGTEIDDTQRHRGHKRGQGSTRAWKNLKGECKDGERFWDRERLQGKAAYVRTSILLRIDVMNMHPTTVPSGGEDLNDAPRCGLCYLSRMCNSDANVTDPFARCPARRATGAGELMRATESAPAAAWLLD